MAGKEARAGAGRLGRGRMGRAMKSKARPSRTKGAYKKRGAYNSRNKKQFKNARRPFVEGKTRSLKDVLSSNVPQASQPPDTLAMSANYDWLGRSTVLLDDAYTGLQMSSFTQQQRGLLEHQMIGNSIFVRYLKAKIKVDFPPINILTKPAKLYLIHGWITTPPNWTTVTTPAVDTATTADLNNFINQRLRQYFDDTQDQMLFRPRIYDNGIKVIKKQKIEPNLQKQFSIPANQPSGPSSMYGAVPSVHKSCTWNVNRKIHFEDSTNGTGLTDYLYPNNTWLPFCVLYNPDYKAYTPDVPGQGGTEEGNRLHILMNNQIWYSDS